MTNGLSPYAGYQDRPIFIGACPRSGTTLLRTMLNTHPDIAIPRETRFMPFAWEHRLKWRNVRRERARERFARVVFESKWTRAERLQTPAEVAIERLRGSPPTLGSLVGTCFQLYAEATGKKRWGDKRPMYARFLDSVFTFFPDSQYINLIRDPRASVASMRKLGWYDGDIVPGLELWVRSVRAVEPWRKCLHDDQLLDVRYEDLVADPVAVLERVADFLTLDHSTIPTMLTYHQNVDETAEKYHSRLREPPSATSVRSWESVLTAEEVALVEHVTRRWMKRHGYEPAAGGRRPPRALLRSYRARRRLVARWRYKTVYDEYKRLIRHRRIPIAARLTSGQTAIEPTAPTPGLWKRNLGKPR
jgi:hypothetical protein